MKSLTQIVEAGQHVYNLSDLSSQALQQVKKEHERRLKAGTPGNWWRSQLSYLENDPYSGYVPPSS